MVRRLCGVRADRLVSLVLLLQARGRLPARALAAELEVSVRTVYRDIAALNTAGVPVVTESGPNGGCWLLDGYRFPLRGLSADEASALLVLGVPAAVAELGLADALAAAQRKISVTSGGGSGSPEPALVHLDMPRWFHGAEHVPHLPALASAVRERRRLRLGYRRGDDRPETTRVVSPLGLVNKAGVWYLVASGAERDGDPAVFRVGRVTSARALAGHRSPGRLASTWRRSGRNGRPRSRRAGRRSRCGCARRLARSPRSLRSSATPCGLRSGRRGRPTPRDSVRSR